MQRVHKSTHMSVCTVISNKLTFLETFFSLYFRWLDLWSRWYLLAHNYSFRGCVKGWRINFDALSGALNISPITHTSFSLCSSLLELSSEVLGIIFFFFFAGWKPFIVQTLPRVNPCVLHDYKGRWFIPKEAKYFLVLGLNFSLGLSLGTATFWFLLSFGERNENVQQETWQESYYWWNVSSLITHNRLWHPRNHQSGGVNDLRMPRKAVGGCRYSGTWNVWPWFGHAVCWIPTGSTSGMDDQVGFAVPRLSVSPCFQFCALPVVLLEVLPNHRSPPGSPSIRDTHWLWRFSRHTGWFFRNM